MRTRECTFQHDLGIRMPAEAKQVQRQLVLQRRLAKAHCHDRRHRVNDLQLWDPCKNAKWEWTC